MTTEINFYEVQEDLFKTIIALLVKIIGEKKRVLIFSVSEQQIRAFDTQIWSYGRSKFIAHGTIFDEELDHARQPILLSNQEKNTNSADYLIFMDSPSAGFINSFSRVFHFFEKSEDLQQNQKFPSEISPTNFFRKTDGKWVRISTAEI